MPATANHWPDKHTQLRVKRVVDKKYGGLSCRHWFADADYLYFELAKENKYIESMPQADFYAERAYYTNTVYLKVNRETLEITEMTEEEMRQTRGWWTDERGIMHWIENK